MSGAILTEPDGIVGPRVDDVRLGQRGQPDGPAHVVAEDEERPAHGEDPTVQRQSVHDPAHPVLPDPEVDLDPSRGPRLLGLGALDGHPVVLRQVGRAGHEARDELGAGVDGRVHGPPGGQLLPGLEARELGLPARHPAPDWAASHAGRSPVQASKRACHCSRRARPRVVEPR